MLLQGIIISVYIRFLPLMLSLN